MADRASRPLTRSELERMAESTRALLDDPDAGLSHDARLRWEGALSALEVAVGRSSTLVGRRVDDLPM